MNAFVESLKRLFDSGNINEDKINELFKNKKITAEERQYILS